MWEGQREREGTCIRCINLELMCNNLCVLSCSSASGTGQSILQIVSRLILQQCYCCLRFKCKKMGSCGHSQPNKTSCNSSKNRSFPSNCSALTAQSWLVLARHTVNEEMIFLLALTEQGEIISFVLLLEPRRCSIDT